MQPIGDSSIEIWDIYIITDFYKGKDEMSMIMLWKTGFIGNVLNYENLKGIKKHIIIQLNLLYEYGYFSHLFLNKTQIERKEALCGKS